MRKTLKRATAFILLFMLTNAPPLQGVSTASVATPEQWIDDLRSKNREVWLKAAYDYKRLEPVTGAVVNSLVAGLKDQNSIARRYCASALGEIDTSPQVAVEALSQALRDSDPFVREHATVALAKVGAPAVKTLSLALRRTDVRLEPPPDLKSDGVHVRLSDYAAVALLKMGRPAARQMVELLSDSDETVRRYATIILKEIGEDALPALFESLGGEPNTSRLDIYSIIAYIGVDTPLDLRTLANALQDKNPKTRSRAVYLLGRFGAQGLPLLAKGLKDSNLEVRRETVRALRSSRNGSPVALGYLTQAVSDTDKHVAREALYELLEWDEKAQAAVPSVAAVVRNTRSTLREEAANFLGSIGPGAVAGAPALLAAFQNGNIRLQRAAAEALGDIGPSASKASPILTAALNRASPALKGDLLCALGKISGHDPKVVKRLARHLNSPSAIVRRGAARGLEGAGKNAQSALPAIVNAILRLAAGAERTQYGFGRIYDKTGSPLFSALVKIGVETTPQLMGLLRHGDEFIRLEAAESLLRLHPSDRQIISAVIPLLRDPSDNVRVFIPLLLVELTKAPDLVAQALADTLKNADRDYVRYLVYAIEELRGQSRATVPAIEDLIGSDDPETRVLALNTLSQIGAPSEAAINALINELKTTDDYRVIEALRNFGKAAVPALAVALNDPDLAVRRNAAEVFSRLGAAAKGAEGPLTSALQDSDPTVRRDAAKALGGIGAAPETLITALAALLTDADEEVRLAAAKALTRLTTNPTQFGLALRAAINDAFIHRLVADALHEITERMRLPSKYASLARPRPQPRPQPLQSTTLPKLPWPPPRFTNYDLVPRNLVGADQNTLADVHTRLAKALQESGYYSNGLFGAPGGFAVVTRVERILNNGAPFPPDTRWTKHKLAPSSLMDYLESLFLEKPGEFRLFVFIVTDLNGIQSGSETLSEDDAFGFAQLGAKILPEDVGKISFKGRNCYALVYRFQKRFGQNTTLESADSLSLEAHLKGAGIWGRLGF